jgi:hypothetical protein
MGEIAELEEFIDADIKKLRRRAGESRNGSDGALGFLTWRRHAKYRPVNLDRIMKVPACSHG